MEISVGQSLLLGLVGGFAIISWIYSFFMMMRALTVSALTGLILGHAKEAIVFGAAAELIYLGLINAAGVTPPNPLGPGLFGTTLLLTEDLPVGTAIAISFPFAVFIQFLIQTIFTVNSMLGTVMEKLVQKEFWNLYKISGHMTGILLFTSGFVLGLSAGLGAESFGEAIAKKPPWLQKGLRVGGRMLPTMGFALVLRLMLKREYMPFLLIGFSLIVVFSAVGKARPEWGGVNLVALAITATGIALITFYSSQLSKSDRKPQRAGIVTEGDGDGI